MAASPVPHGQRSHADHWWTLMTNPVRSPKAVRGGFEIIDRALEIRTRRRGVAAALVRAGPASPHTVGQRRSSSITFRRSALLGEAVLDQDRGRRCESRWRPSISSVSAAGESVSEMGARRRGCRRTGWPPRAGDHDQRAPAFPSRSRHAGSAADPSLVIVSGRMCAHPRFGYAVR